jgi:hypothetical protein
MQSTSVSAQAPSAPSATRWTTFLNQLAASLNIQRSALDQAIGTAATNTLAAEVQAGTLTQAQADAITARVQAGGLGALFGGRGGPRGGSQSDAGVHQAMFDAAAAALNLTPETLRTRLREGATLASLATAAGTTEQAVTNAALAAARTTLDAAVAAGSLTQAQADEVYARLQAKGTALLTHGGRGPGGRGGPPRTAPTATTVPTT